MKLSMLTYDLARPWTLTKLIEVARACGYAGIEFRAEEGHQHSVELDRTKAERRRIREQLEDAYLEAVGIGTGCRFDSTEPSERKANVEHARRYVELAADVGAHRIRVFGDDLKAATNREDCIRYVGESLRAVAEFAQPLGVDVLLEMHGQFNYWGFTRAAVEAAGHPRVALVYNCDVRDLVAGSVATTYARVRGLIRHVHMHTFYDGFPYPELLSLLAADGYTGYLSSEIEGIENPTREQYFAMYAALFRAWAGQPFWPGGV
ncbi:MAG TPA: sugar phosphate isomerase/epimerase family protein [Spirochaetia bacterium]|nr:sugar phosphate isomerase/epimerase family protein [Spirochaetia bacterium]